MFMFVNSSFWIYILQISFSLIKVLNMKGFFSPPWLLDEWKRGCTGRNILNDLITFY